MAPLLALACATLCAASPAGAERGSLRGYAARVVTTIESQGTKTVVDEHQQLYQAGTLVVEATGPRLTYLLSPGQAVVAAPERGIAVWSRDYVPTPTRPGFLEPSSLVLGETPGLLRLGQEVVEGTQCQVMEQPATPDGHRAATKLWVSPLGVVMRKEFAFGTFRVVVGVRELQVNPHFGDHQFAAETYMRGRATYRLPRITFGAMVQLMVFETEALRYGRTIAKWPFAWASCADRIAALKPLLGDGIPLVPRYLPEGFGLCSVDTDTSANPSLLCVYANLDTYDGVVVQQGPGERCCGRREGGQPLVPTDSGWLTAWADPFPVSVLHTDGPGKRSHVEILATKGVSEADLRRIAGSLEPSEG
jgi:hypothetical protein